MKKIRINELARELEVKPGVILDLLPDLGVQEKKTHSSSIDEEVALALRDRLIASGELHNGSARTDHEGYDDRHEEENPERTATAEFPEKGEAPGPRGTQSAPPIRPPMQPSLRPPVRDANVSSRPESAPLSAPPQAIPIPVAPQPTSAAAQPAPIAAPSATPSVSPAAPQARGSVQLGVPLRPAPTAPAAPPPTAPVESAAAVPGEPER
ncbi:MAG: bacterial translation initiation factor 2 (bIF-2), partial [Bryobacterales bacterium]|nr:bacterial translation initiation factor 2 (bIF-2) [Bryobacterales bacterium]